MKNMISCGDHRPVWYVPSTGLQHRDLPRSAMATSSRSRGSKPSTNSEKANGSSTDTLIKHGKNILVFKTRRHVSPRIHIVVTMQKWFWAGSKNSEMALDQALTVLHHPRAKSKYSFPMHRVPLKKIADKKPSQDSSCGIVVQVPT